jgi:DNA mismatch repair ATPase MutL
MLRRTPIDVDPRLPHGGGTVVCVDRLFALFPLRAKNIAATQKEQALRLQSLFQHFSILCKFIS